MAANDYLMAKTGNVGSPGKKMGGISSLMVNSALSNANVHSLRSTSYDKSSEQHPMSNDGGGLYDVQELTIPTLALNG